MTRTLTSSLNAAINSPGSYAPIARITVYPSNVFFPTLHSNTAVTGADAIGSVNDPMGQDIEYSSVAGGLVTFFSSGGYLCYALEGGSDTYTTTHPSTVKPGVKGGKIFLFDGTNVKRYSIDYSAINVGGTSPLSEEASVVPGLAPLAIHAVSTTEAVLICGNDGGFSVIYLTGTSQITSDSRFMFPKIADWDESSRTMGDMAKFSAGAKLGDRIFAYMSAAHSGVVNGVYYDTITGSWSDIFIAMPTDKSVSMCEFRIANAFTRNEKIYLCGMLVRTDAYEGSLPYTLIMGSRDGLVFSIDRFSLVTNMGYRFHAHVGTDNQLYIANCNRISSGPSTWVFDGDSLETCPKSELGMNKIAGVNASDVFSATFDLKGGDEGFVDDPYIVEGSRIVFEMGYKTPEGDEYVIYSNYIISAINIDRSKERTLGFACTHMGKWNMSNLSMPFYAEMTGISSTYDSMNKDTGLLYAAPSNARYQYKFWVDFWKNKPYVNAGQGITGIPAGSGGLDAAELTGNHKAGMKLDGDIRTVIGTGENPEITASSIDLKIYGWSHTLSAGGVNDTIHIALFHTDENDKDEQVIIQNTSKKWPMTYVGTASGESPITHTFTGLTAGRRIKNVAIIAQAANTTRFYPWRIEFTNNVKVPITLPETGVTWVKQDDGTFKIPGTGQPFVMFSQKPYNAFNFTLAAKFTNSVTGGISGYPVAVGLVGLGKDAENFIVARYDKVTNKVQLAKIRDTFETLLHEETPGFSVGDEVSMQFSHRDGNFKVYILDPGSDTYVLVLEYDWQASDGFLAASLVTSLKCGLYGAIEGPMVQIVSYSHGQTDLGAFADGIPLDPMGDMTDFPTSGKLRIGTNVYSYTSKIAMPSIVRGPSQLRSYGIYPPPYGNGSHGLQCRDHDWTAAASLVTGKLIATDGGSVFLSTGSNWQPFITTGGARQYLPGRSTHYSANTQISKFPASGYTKVFITGGFAGIGFVSGTPGIHRQRDWARYELEGTITCHWFMGAGGEVNQTTIQDLMRNVCSLSGVPISFPGNVEDASLVVAGETDLFEDQYAEGFDLNFETAAPESFEIRTNVRILPDNYEEKDDILLDTGTSLDFTDEGGGEYTLAVLSTPSNTEMFKLTYPSSTGYQRYRVMYHENNLSVFQNEKWVTTVTFDKLIYDQTDRVDVKAYHATSMTMLNMVAKDLAELREAVYIDLETDGNAAIGGIIQERPIEIIPLPDGGLQAFYEYDRPVVSLALAPEKHTIMREIPQGAASDGIVYGSHEVVTIQFPEFAGKLGLATKLFRFPSLNIGAVEAAQRLLKKLYERREMTTISCRPQLAPLVGEILHIDYTLAGLNKAVEDHIIIESTTLSLTNAKNFEASMTINGRKYSA